MNNLTILKWVLAVLSGMIIFSTVAIIGIFIHYGGWWLIGALGMSIIGTRQINKILKDFKRIREIT